MFLTTLIKSSCSYSWPPLMSLVENAKTGMNLPKRRRLAFKENFGLRKIILDFN